MVFLAGCMLICFVLCLRSPGHAIGVIAFSMIAHGVLIDIFGQHFIHAPFYLTLIAILVLSYKKQLHPPGKFLQINCLLFILILFASSFLGIDQANSLNTTLLYIKALGFCLLISMVKFGDLDIERIISAIAFACFVGVSMILYQYLSGSFYISSIYEQRAAGLRSDPNETAMLLLLCLPAVAYKYTNSKSTFAKLNLGALALGAIASISLTGSRGGLIALALLAVTAISLFPNKRTLSTLIAIAIVLAVATPESTLRRIDSTFSGDAQFGAASFAGRLQLLKEGVDVFLSAPLFGVGPGNFSKARFETNEATVFVNKEHRVAHNTYIEFLAETGIFCLLVFLSLCCYAMSSLLTQRGKNMYSASDSIHLGLLSILLSGITLSIGHYSLLWLFIGLSSSNKLHSLNH